MLSTGTTPSYGKFLFDLSAFHEILNRRLRMELFVFLGVTDNCKTLSVWQLWDLGATWICKE